MVNDLLLTSAGRSYTQTDMYRIILVRTTFSVHIHTLRVDTYI